MNAKTLSEALSLVRSLEPDARWDGQQFVADYDIGFGSCIVAYAIPRQDRVGEYWLITDTAGRYIGSVGA